MRQQQRHHAEDPLELLLHRVAHRLEHRVARTQPLLQRAEHLVGAVVADDLGRQQELDGGRIERTSGCSVRSLLSEAMTRWRSVGSACSRLPISTCSASTVPIRTSTDGQLAP